MKRSTVSFPHPHSSCLLLACAIAAAVVGPFLNAHAAARQPALHQDVPLDSKSEFWSKEAGILRYVCKEGKLEARSKHSPSVKFLISDGPFNTRDCSAAVASLETKGCFCDEQVLRCLETERVEPETYICGSDLRCLVFEGRKKGVVRIATLGDHITRNKCEQELADVERAPKPAPVPLSKQRP